MFCHKGDQKAQTMWKFIRHFNLQRLSGEHLRSGKDIDNNNEFYFVRNYIRCKIINDKQRFPRSKEGF